ncbi:MULTISPECIES: copper-binding protein [unclassified Gordonia (in: high G+C Gram-positive bacteria)]|uniref:copper-binding protein n=1 Tax=unclassified Gordonia (in: high G+C Gram-positive bacteria) TaxID=2657482 RepID=UPI001FFEE56A|nr:MULTISPECIES: copper-binding protein [unclassified Gordonia (in: high G+C Gram-positive bacteria)]UQE74653.1 copper-binding protein [Gordonia sp. PP30]
MSVFTRTTRRIAKGATIGALGIAVAMGTTACGAGKISQTNNQDAAINGANGTIKLDPAEQLGDQTVEAGTIAIRNLQIIYPVDKASEIWGDGGPFKLAFTIANDSNIRTIKLTGITAGKGTVQFLTRDASGNVTRSATPGDAGTMAPNTAISTGNPQDPANAEALAKAADVTYIEAELSGTGDTVAAGQTTPLTLHFDVYDLGKGGAAPTKLGPKQKTIEVPVDASALDRQDVVRDAQPAEQEGEGGH